MFEHIHLKSGRSHGSDPETITVTPVTVFVGPNNAGKSLVLTEIHQFCHSGQQDVGAKIIREIDFQTTPLETALEKISKVTLSPNPGEAQNPGHIFVGKKGSRLQVPEEELKLAVQNPNKRKNQFCNWYLSYNTLILNGNNRINLVNQQKSWDLQLPPSTSFQVLFSDDDKREEVRRIIHDAFSSYLVVDPTSIGNLRLRLSPRAPQSPEEERGLHKEAVDFHSEALSIEDASDGVKAFTGMITEIIAGDPNVLLIDEPEAFLHPSLSNMLGKEIAVSTAGTDKRLCVSTHSASFVMGCIQSGTPVNIVRLTYRSGSATARILTSEHLLPLMRNPLLRSSGVLNALFYEFVIVTESDADRAFYQEINERLLSKKRGIPNCLFLNAQNKQTVKTILKPLREIGIPAAGIVDIDVIKDGGSVWTGFMDSCFIPEIEKASLATLRANIKTKLDAKGGDMKREGGINLLAEADREGASNFIDRLNQYGLFVVRAGELEVWLPELNVEGHGPSWLIKIFEKMGEDPSNAKFVWPGSEDVWGFIEEIRSWLINSQRNGIPT